jgi:hypothetical protein
MNELDRGCTDSITRRAKATKASVLCHDPGTERRSELICPLVSVGLRNPGTFLPISLMPRFSQRLVS